jgi:hypothetical protein
MQFGAAGIAKSSVEQTLRAAKSVVRRPANLRLSSRRSFANRYWAVIRLLIARAPDDCSTGRTIPEVAVLDLLNPDQDKTGQDARVVGCPRLAVSPAIRFVRLDHQLCLGRQESAPFQTKSFGSEEISLVDSTVQPIRLPLQNRIVLRPLVQKRP